VQRLSPQSEEPTPNSQLAVAGAMNDKTHALVRATYGLFGTPARPRSEPGAQHMQGKLSAAYIVVVPGGKVAVTAQVIVEPWYQAGLGK
jgi:hypothetical protein